MQLVFNKEQGKETKNTVRYKEDDEVNPVVGTLYVKKAHELSKENKLVVEIKAA